jgi:hypothetical protein
MYYNCGPEAICNIELIAEVGGGPIDLSATRLVPFDAFDAPTIVAVGGEQDAIDVSFYDGASASLGFVLTTPEPTSVLLLVTILVGFGAGVKRKSRRPRAGA